MAAKIVMSAAYGIDVLPSNDPYVDLAEKAVDGLVTAVVPGRFLVVRHFAEVQILDLPVAAGQHPSVEIHSSMVPWCRFPA